MPGVVGIGKELEISALGLLGDGFEAWFEGGEESGDVAGGDVDAYVEGHARIGLRLRIRHFGSIFDVGKGVKKWKSGEYGRIVGKGRTNLKVIVDPYEVNEDVSFVILHTSTPTPHGRLVGLTVHDVNKTTWSRDKGVRFHGRAFIEGFGLI